MIFKTFENNDIDKWIAKIGLFGKSFNDVIDSINKRKLDIDNLMSSGLVSSYSDAKKQVGGIFSYLYSKNDIKSQLIDVDSVFPKIDTSNVKEIKAEIVDMSKSVANNEITWQELFDILPIGEKHFAELGLQMEGQIITEDGLILANEKARASAIAHNNALKQQTLGAKAATIAMKGLAMVGNMLFMFAATKALELIVKAIDDYVHRLDNAKEALESTQSELESVNKEIDETTSKIKELESIDNLSIIDKEDLEQLKLQNEELRIRQKYLEAQEQKDKEKVAKYTEQSYRNKYGESVDRSDIDKYKESYNTPKSQTASTYLTGGSNTTSTPYGAGQQAQEQEEGNRLAELIAKYEYYSDLKKKAIQDEDSEAIEKYNQKLESISDNLSENRTELQGFKDDIEASGEASPYLDEIKDKLKLIDDTLLSPGQNLVNFINSEELESDKEKLIELANSGNLTQDELEKNFSNVNDYLKENGLTLEDLIGIIKIYKEELESVPNETPIYSLQSYLDQENMSEVKKSLLELAKSGKITEETFNSTEEYRKLLTDLGMDAEEASEKLKEMASEDSDMEDWQKQLQSARTSIEELTKIKSSISSSGITSDSLDTIISKYPELLAYSDDMQGMLSAIDNFLYEQKDAAQVAGDALLDYSTVIYDQVVSSIYEDCANANSNLINELAQGYNIDLNNFSSLAQAKEAIDTQLLQTLMEMWGKYYGIVVDSVTGLASVTQNLPDFYQNEEAQNQLATYNQIITKLNATKDKFEKGLNFGSVDSAGSAGKESADAYLEAFEKELGDLDDLKDRGVISEKEYLDHLRELYTRYFKDKKQYLDQYNKYEKQYLDGMESLYNSALSGITKLMGKQIDKYSEEKEVAVSSLEEERDARLAVIDAQKEQLQSQIDLIEKQIDDKQKEIDAINDAADARKRELDLQKAQYELERARNQRTILQYSEEKGMHYVKDDSAERDAKENVDDAKREIQIAAIQKEIDLLNEQKDAIQEQIDLLDKQSDQIEEYYSKMIESTEKYYDSLIKSMENQKSKWEELADIKEVADAYSAVQQIFGDLGYTVEDVLSGNEQAFEDFRNKYIALMNDMNSNSWFGDGLSYATGKAKEDLGSFLDSTNEVADGLDNLSEKSSAVDGVATSLGNASTSASELSTNTNGLSDNLNGISDSLNNFPTEDKFSGLTTQFTELGKAIGEVAKALGIDGEGSVNSLVTALSGISEISLGDEQTGVIAQFNALASAVNAVSSAINGTGGGVSSDPQDSKSQSMSAGATGTSGSITYALDELKSKADEVLGTGGGEDSTGEGTIGQFEQLEQAVKDVSTAIGSGGGEGEESGGKSNGEEDADNLIGAITSLGEQSEETLGESGGEGVIGRFEQFRDVINEANEHVTGISDGLDAIDGKEVECTIKINIESNGSIPHFAEGTVLGNMNLDSSEYKAKYGSAHVAGTANVQGNWGVREAGKSLVGEEGQELWVHRGTGKFETVGNRGAEFINVQKGDLIFNHEQTKQLLRDGQISSRGKAYANGTANKPSVLDRLRAQGYEVQKYEWKDMYGNLISPQQMNEAAKAWVSGTYECLTPMNDFKEKIKETVKVIEGANVVNNTMNQQPINVTMGDIHLHEVQDVDGLSKAIIHQMPGKMLQAIHQK